MASCNPRKLSDKRSKSALRRYLISQFARPRGIMGRLAGLIMSRRRSNVLRNMWTVDLMNLKPGHRVLEIGFGPGRAVQLVCSRVGDGKVVGLDHSETMRRMAARRNRASIADGQLTLLTGSVEGDFEGRMALELPFDRIFAVNVAMFWDDPIAVLVRLGDLLADDGQIFLTVQPRTGCMSREAVIAIAGDLAGHMRDAGLVDIETAIMADLEPPAVSVRGCRDG